MLHAADIPGGVALVSKKGYGRKEYALQGGDGAIYEKGTKVAVFVKEVYKNSGRFTVTLDANVDKATVLQERLKVRSDGNARRRRRRLRRQLEEVAVGDSVRGVVQGVADDGILITVTGLGAFNVTGLMEYKDLPRHMEV